jgi:hypothetical protein
MCDFFMAFNTVSFLIFAVAIINIIFIVDVFIISLYLALTMFTEHRGVTGSIYVSYSEGRMFD